MITPCWILCTPRTGSSYLCEILNNLKYFPTYDSIYPDLFNNHSIGPLKSDRSFGEWLRLYTLELFQKYPPIYTKAINHQFNRILTLDLTVEILPNIKFIILKRRNVINHTSSYYMAKKLNQYHVYNSKMLNQYQKSKTNINTSE